MADSPLWARAGPLHRGSLGFSSNWAQCHGRKCVYTATRDIAKQVSVSERSPPEFGTHSGAFLAGPVSLCGRVHRL
eukprot:6682723-Alexandrium_andersonii.AAC.1